MSKTISDLVNFATSSATTEHYPTPEESPGERRSRAEQHIAF